MATAGPHMQKTEVSWRAEEVIGFLMAIGVVSWERLWLGPCAVYMVSHRGNVVCEILTEVMTDSGCKKNNKQKSYELTKNLNLFHIQFSAKIKKTLCNV